MELAVVVRGPGWCLLGYHAEPTTVTVHLHQKDTADGGRRARAIFVSGPLYCLTYLMSRLGPTSAP
jgi:hypothetical protein